MSSMKTLLKAWTVTAMVVLGFAANSKAQVQQSISFSFTVYNQVDTSVRPLRISTKDVIANLVGTNVPGGKLWLVMPDHPFPDGSGNIGASLRVTDAKGNILVDTTSDYFNIYQEFFSQTATHTYAWNQFSLAFGGLFSELYGTVVWNKSFKGPGGQGSFHCTVSGHCAISGITDDKRPCTGSISGGSPKPVN
jgi:hypothetical protein